MIISLLSIFLIYFLLTICLCIIWLKIPVFNPPTTKNSSPITFISVIIPVRNESENILFLLQDLEKQTYPKGNFEVIIANDNSWDNTLEIIEKFAQNCSISLIINNLKEKESNTSPKKRAINACIELAKGELITTTDGDCRVPEKWLETIEKFYSETNAELISGAVTFKNTNKSSFFEELQTIEFASLIGSGACSMYACHPNMCNGANLTYRKSAFLEVGGFSGNEHLASGDDEFLMQKIAKRFPEKVQFLKNKNSIVTTLSHENLISFYQQRKRWASKWRHYQKPMTSVLAIFIFTTNFSLLLSLVLCLLSQISVSYFLFFVGLKFSAEFIFLTLILCYLRKYKSILLIPLLQLIYPFYVVFFGIVAQGKGYEWKGRKLA